MKESRFIELLNLYIDQQITPEDAARLEEDILANPRHRRTYQQYCRMHRACTMVFASAQGDSTATEGSHRADVLVSLEFVPRRSPWKYYAAGLAAAAGLAFAGVQLFVRPVQPTPRETFAAAPAARPAPAPAAFRPAAGSWRPDAAIAPDAFATSAPLATVSFATVSVPDRTAPDPLRPSVEEFVFEQAPAGPGSAATFRNRPQDGREAEMTAFQFQR